MSGRTNVNRHGVHRKRKKGANWDALNDIRDLPDSVKGVIKVIASKLYKKLPRP